MPKTNSVNLTISFFYVLYMLSCSDENLSKCVVVIVLGFVVYNVLKDNLKLFIYDRYLRCYVMSH